MLTVVSEWQTQGRLARCLLALYAGGRLSKFRPCKHELLPLGRFPCLACKIGPETTNTFGVLFEMPRAGCFGRNHACRATEIALVAG